MLDIKTAEEQGSNFASSLKCSSLAELRAKPANEIQNAENKPSNPIIDGYTILEIPIETYKKKKQNNVPLLVGWNKDETRGMISPMKTTVLIKEIEKYFGAFSKDVLKVYPFQADVENTQLQAD